MHADIYSGLRAGSDLTHDISRTKVVGPDAVHCDLCMMHIADPSQLLDEVRGRAAPHDLLDLPLGNVEPAPEDDEADEDCAAAISPPGAVNLRVEGGFGTSEHTKGGDLSGCAYNWFGSHSTPPTCTATAAVMAAPTLLMMSFK